MKVLYIGVLKNETKPAIELAVVRDLSSFGMFTRNTVSEFMSFTAKEVIAPKTKPGQRQAIQEEKEDKNPYTFHVCGRSEGVCGVIITDNEYPARVAQGLLSKVCDEFLNKYPRSAFANAAPGSADKGAFPYPELKEYITKYQNPEQEDSLLNIQRELDETQVVIRKTMESMLERGEKIDNLVAKSDGLSAQSKMFYTQAKKQNSCCVVM